MGKQKWRIGITALCIVIAIVASWKTVKLWSMDEAARQSMLESDPDGYKSLVTGAMRLGLDLQGGIHTVVRVKLEDITEAARVDAVERVKEIIRNRVDPEGVFEPIIQTQGDDRIIVDLPGWKDEKRAEQLIGNTARLEFKMLQPIEKVLPVFTRIDSIVAALNGVTVGGSDDESASDASDTEASESADDASTSDDDLLAELLGDTTSDTTAGAADDFSEEKAPFSSLSLGGQSNQRTGVLWPAFTFPTSAKKKIQRWFEMPAVKRVIPPGMQIAYSTRNTTTSDQLQVFEMYFLEDEVRFLGESLEGIRLGTDQMQKPTVDFALSGRAAAQFANMTGNNIDKPFAIVLDDKVESAPFINSRIRNRGQITMGGGDASEVREDAQILVTVLKAGSLPAPVEIIEKNLVGPTLGSDSIQKGYMSSLVGLALVMVFIGIYYRMSGVIADVALVFNLFFLLAIMAGLGATLTMPGIAGIILTIGIAVDANILIFERIREEMITGKNVRAAIDAGYDRALLAIIDSHVTTLITAAALFWFGSGPIRGFAVTLFWGVALSLFTAVVITRTIFDFRKQYKSLSV